MNTGGPRGSIISVLALAAVLLCTGLLAPKTLAWTPCDRSFHFGGMMYRDTCVISFLEQSWGECEYRNMHHVIIGPDGKLIKDSIERDWNGDNAIISTLEGYKLGFIYRLRESDSVFRDPWANIPMYQVRAPVFDSSFSAIWGDSVRKAVTLGLPKVFRDSLWLKLHIDHPRFAEDNPRFAGEMEFVYSYPFGLYKNYTIMEVLVVQNYFFILTHQPLLTGEETFDGVLIYRWNGRI